MDSIKDEKQKKETEQQSIINNYNDLNKDIRRNSSVDILNEYISQLEGSKKAKKTITEKYIETKLVDTDKRTLRCTVCEKNCHVDCDCKWAIPFTSGRSWWCNNIENDYCKVCDCYYEKHQREKKWYVHETKERSKNVGLSNEEIQEIDNNIKDIREKVKKEKELEEKINEHDKNINQYEETVNHTNHHACRDRLHRVAEPAHQAGLAGDRRQARSSQNHSGQGALQLFVGERQGRVRTAECNR
jgi:hypothetical protein